MSKKNMIYSLLFIVFIASCIMIFYPKQFIVYAWHLLNSDKYVYKKIELNIPKKWFIASKDDNVITLLRVPLRNDEDPICLTVRKLEKIGNTDYIIKKVESFCKIEKIEDDLYVGGTHSIGFLCKDLTEGKKDESFWYLVVPDKKIVISSSRFNDNSFSEVKNANFEVLDNIKWLD